MCKPKVNVQLYLCSIYKLSYLHHFQLRWYNFVKLPCHPPIGPPSGLWNSEYSNQNLKLFLYYATVPFFLFLFSTSDLDTEFMCPWVVWRISKSSDVNDLTILFSLHFQLFATHHVLMEAIAPNQTPAFVEVDIMEVDAKQVSRQMLTSIMSKCIWNRSKTSCGSTLLIISNLSLSQFC